MGYLFWLKINEGQSNFAIGGISTNWEFRHPNPSSRGNYWGPCLIECYLGPPDMVEVDAGYGSTSVHIGWSDEVERNARGVTISGSSKQYRPLYGDVVGVANRTKTI